MNMGSLKSLAFLALLLSLSLAVFAETSKDATHDEVKPSEAIDAIEPKQRGQPQAAEAETEAKDVVVEPQQGWGGGCRYGCCGWFLGRCNYCCRRPQTVEAEAVEANDVEPQQGGRGGCRYGCCRWRYGRCNYCCKSPQAETEAVEAVEPQQSTQAVTEAVEAVEPQQRWGGGCRYGCCNWRYGRCAYCCRSAQAETEAVETIEPQQGWGGGCRYGCCRWRYGRCAYCCTKKMTMEEEKEEEEAKP